MLTCYIIDDELHAIKSLVSYIERTPMIRLLGYNQSPVNAIRHFEEQGTYADITFVDIEMPELSGLELSAMLTDKTSVVFTTAHPNFAPEAYDLNIKDYLLKPISYARFLKCVNKLAGELKTASGHEKTGEFFYIQTEGKGKLVKVLYSDISYIESQKNYLAIVTGEKKYLTYLSLSEIEQKLPSSFIRIHKSYIVNTDKISHIEGNNIILEDKGTVFALGAGFKEQFIRFMDAHLLKSRRFPR